MRSNYFRPEIQSLRAVAVIAVMVFHLNPTWLPGGFVGVDVFLVISGFLITSILLDRKSCPEYNILVTLKYFYLSRIKRIAPAYFTMLLIVALISAVFLLPQDFKVFKKGLEKTVWFASNNYFAPASYEKPLLQTLSLAVEIQFYLISPFLILLQSEAFRYALDIFLEEINKGGTIYILSQESLLNYHPQRSRKFEYLGVDASIGLDKRRLSTNDLLRDLSVSENKKIKFIELDEINLFKRTPYWNGELIFYDTHHINEVGAKEHAKQALPIISKELFYDQ
ncbi:acyltransferase family protein [Amphritea sp. 1_MG-2023]|uniref:acyltransferase family protein n=1 Tax=Amphritea sp. 1_MG-2023 TaxID=3062670 RepID=UPI0026E23B79|nr:acyltransferase family protein [Amphritea sp. 1_MG-2023]MDO6564000.1 acyltransferase family protein [Amphritea sp. 1_MG-2023]